MTEWELIPNPAYQGEPRILEAECHDRTPFITVLHTCGAAMHLHESQLKHIPATVEIATMCQKCEGVLVFPPGYFERAFQQLRDEGWIQ